WYLMRIMPYRTAENVIDGLVLTFVDINRLKDAQKHLGRMSKVFMTSLDPIFIVDSENKIVDLNDQALNIYGYPRVQLLGRPIDTIVSTKDQKLLGELLARCWRGDLIGRLEDVLVNKAGEESPRVLWLQLLTDDQGEPDAVAVRTRRAGE